MRMTFTLNYLTERNKIMEEFIKLDESYLKEIAALYRSAFMGEPWNDNWSDSAQLEE